MDSGTAIDIILDGMDECGLAELRKQGIDYIYPDWGLTALGLAVAYGKEKSAAILLEHGANPNIFGEKGWPPLSDAYNSRHPALVALLLLHGADPDLHPPKGFSLRETLRIDGAQEFLDHLSGSEEAR